MGVTTNVRVAKFCTDTGFTDKAVRRKMETGVWLEGYEYHKAANGDVTIFVPGYERWAQGLPRLTAKDLANANQQVA